MVKADALKGYISKFTKIKDTPAQEQFTDYKQTKTEWASKNRELIITSAYGIASTLIYQVPVNKTFYLTGCSLNGVNSAVGTAIFYLFVYPNSANCLASLRVTNGAPKETNISFSMPVSLRAGTIIQASSDSANFSIFASVIGYLEDD
jgi:hypothetical protein